MTTNDATAREAGHAVPEPDAAARDGLRERIAQETYYVRPNYTEDGDKVPWEGLTDAFRAWRCEEADKVVALVTAARDAEIRSALLSDGAVIESVDSIRTSPVLDRSSYHSLPPEGPGAGEPGNWLGHELRREWREYVGRPAIEAALDHIGLGDGTGGQG